MTIEVKWYMENKIIHVLTQPIMEVEDVQYVSENIIKLIDQSDEPLVHVILSEENVESIPKSLTVFNEIAKFVRHERIGWFLIYGNVDRARVVKFLGTMVVQMAKVRHRRFDTFDECLEFLVGADPSLPSIEELKRK